MSGVLRLVLVLWCLLSGVVCCWLFASFSILVLESWLIVFGVDCVLLMLVFYACCLLLCFALLLLVLCAVVFVCGVRCVFVFATVSLLVIVL